MAPQVLLGFARLDWRARRAREHGDNRGKLRYRRVALDDVDMRLVMLFVTHSGMFPCFFGGIWLILRSSRRSAVAT